MKSILLLFIMIFSSSSSQLEESYPQQYPFVAVLRSSNMRCSAAMISQSAVLTVSQCLATSIIEVTLGAFDLTHANQLERGRIRFQVNSDAFRFDPQRLLGIIRFFPLAMLNNFVNIARIPFSLVDENYGNAEAVAMGFLREPLKYDSMHAITISILNNNGSCATNQVNQSDLMCSQASAVCHLNIGAPLIISNGGDTELIGILTFPESECNEQQPSGFFRINQFFKFIRGNM